MGVLAGRSVDEPKTFIVNFPLTVLRRIRGDGESLGEIEPVRWDTPDDADDIEEIEDTLPLRLFVDTMGEYGENRAVRLREA